MSGIDFVDQSPPHVLFAFFNLISYHCPFSFLHFPHIFYGQLPSLTMYAARAAKPKLSLSISAAQNTRSSLSLKSPGVAPRTPISPSPAASSPGGKRFSTLQPPTYNYTNSCSSKSILKKHPGASSHADKRIQFKNTPTVHCVTPIENPEEYYGTHTKLSREERRWTVRE